MKKVTFILFFQLLFSQSLVEFNLENSYISYDGKHPAHNWTGISKEIQGSFELDIDDLTQSKIDLYVPVFSFDSKKRTHLAITIYGTRTIWRGNRIDELNTFDFLMNPIGGTINGSFFTSYSINKNELKNTKLALSLGKKWIQGPPLPNFKNSSKY